MREPFSAGGVSLPDGLPPAFRGEFCVEEARRTAFCEHAGILRSVPAAIAVPVDAEDVSALLRWAWGHRVPVVPRGAGTGMPGGLFLRPETADSGLCVAISPKTPVKRAV